MAKAKPACQPATQIRPWSKHTWNDDSEDGHFDQADLDEAWVRWMGQRPAVVPESRSWLPHEGDVSRVPQASDHLPALPAEEPEARDSLEELGAAQGAAGAGRAPLPACASPRARGDRGHGVNACYTI